MSNRKQFFEVLQIIAGAFIAAVSINTFIVPQHLLVGGVSGIAVMINYLTNIPIGIVNFIFNIPLFIIGYYCLHRGFLWRSLLGMSAFSFFLVLLRGVVLLPVNDLLLAGLIGGALNGIGYGLVFRGHGSSGGTDIISMIIHRFFSFHIGACNFLFNIAVLTLAAFVFHDIYIAGYTLLSLFVTSNVIDRIQLGFNTNQTAIIISDQAEDIANKIIKDIHRGVTFLNGEGGYTHKAKKVMVSTFSLTQLAKLKELVATTDPHAFMIVLDATEVMGKGFNKGLNIIDHH